MFRSLMDVPLVFARAHRRHRGRVLIEFRLNDPKLGKALAMRTRTSRSHPLAIDVVLAPGGGQIGMTLCPGRIGPSAGGPAWERDLDADLDAVEAWKPDLILTLMQDGDFAEAGVPQFAAVLGRRFAAWRHLPIVDGGVPDAAFERAWATTGAEARGLLSRGGKVLIHCRAGLGRTGTLAARLLVELGSSADDAMSAVREARANTIENRDQEEHVRRQRPVADAPPTEPVELSATFHRALMDAEFYHHDQKRKSTSVPYFSHLLGVCSLVLEAGGTETEAIAALLHDAPEDAGGAPVLAAIAQNFGAEVARIVDGLSDALPEKGAQKPPWRKRKEDYLAHLRGADPSTVLVSAADKLHNLRAIQSDHQQIGDAVFERFSTSGDKRTQTLWYYRALFEVYRTAQFQARDPRLARLTLGLGEILDWFDEGKDERADV